MKSLVTGGAGFIGSHIVDCLIKNGDEVVVIDNLATGKIQNINAQTKHINLDISNPKTSEVVTKEKPDRIFHLAAQALVTVSVKDPIRDADVNIKGFLYLMEGAAKAGVKKVIFSSTGGAIYGDTDQVPTPETYNARPLSPYGIAKLSCEHYLDFYREVHGISSTTVRYSNVYGPRQNPFGEGGAVAIFTNKLLSEDAPTIFGDGSMTRDYTYVSDVVDANIKAAESEKSGPFNIGTQIETSTEELFNKIKELIGSNLTAIHADERPGEVQRSVVDISKAREDLGWEPLVSLEDGLKRTIEAFKESKPSQE
jgi:UDP-glucose 4-epimerase